MLRFYKNYLKVIDVSEAEIHIFKGASIINSKCIYIINSQGRH